VTDFKAKMHQIRFRLGLRPRPRWGAYSAPSDPLAGFGAAGEGLRWERGGGKVGGEEEGGGSGGEEKGGSRSYC